MDSPKTYRPTTVLVGAFSYLNLYCIVSVYILSLSVHYFVYSIDIVVESTKVYDQGAMSDIDDVNLGDNGFWKLYSTHVTELSHPSHLDFYLSRLTQHSDIVGRREETRVASRIYLIAIEFTRARSM
jgi:hypothetical protein